MNIIKRLSNPEFSLQKCRNLNFSVYKSSKFFFFFFYTNKWQILIFFFPKRLFAFFITLDRDAIRKGKENLFLFWRERVLPHLSFHFHLQNAKHRTEYFDFPLKSFNCLKNANSRANSSKCITAASKKAPRHKNWMLSSVHM